MHSANVVWLNSNNGSYFKRNSQRRIYSKWINYFKKECFFFSESNRNVGLFSWYWNNILFINRKEIIEVPLKFVRIMSDFKGWKKKKKVYRTLCDKNISRLSCQIGERENWNKRNFLKKNIWTQCNSLFTRDFEIQVTFCLVQIFFLFLNQLKSMSMFCFCLLTVVRILYILFRDRVLRTTALPKLIYLVVLSSIC